MAGYIKGLCVCGNRQESKGWREKGQYFGMHCTSCRKNKARLAFILKHELICQQCGFAASHRCQLDVDHIDGNSNNNLESNFQLLCANCHRLKTYLNEDWKSL